MAISNFKSLCWLDGSGGLSSLVQSLKADLQHRSSLFKDHLTGRGGLSSPSSEHLAEERRMLTAGLTSSICPFSFFLLRAHNRVEGTGVICVEKVDLIACDARKEALFFRRAWRAIRPSLIPAWGAIMMGGLSSQNTQMAICSGGSSPSFSWQILYQI